MTKDVKLLVNLLDAHFPDLRPNSYEINNMKFDLNVSKVKFITNDQDLQFKNQGNYSILLKVLYCIFLEGTHLHMHRNEIFCRWAVAI